MSDARGRTTNAQHVALAVLALWLVLTSPWTAMYGRMPASAGWLDRAHVVIGLVVLGLTLSYSWSCTRGGGWRAYFPLSADLRREIGREARGLLSGRVPAAEGGGLFGVTEGLLLVALGITALTGLAWYLTQGSGAALEWRAAHAVVARTFIGLLVLHVITVSLHLIEFIRD